MDQHSESRLLRISSKDRSVESASKYSIVYKTNDNDLHQIKKVVLKSAVIPNTQYNINSNNNRFLFSTSAHFPIFLIAVVPVGQYTTSTLMSALQSAMNAMLSSASITITQDALTQKITFALNSGTLHIVGEGNPMAPALGIHEHAAGSQIYTADGLPNLTGLTHIYISSQTLSNHTSMITNEKLKRNVFCDLTVRVPFGQYQMTDEDSRSLDFSIFHSHKNISTIDIQLMDEYNNVLDLNGEDWSLIFRVYR
jgi:hypothetical protein